MTRPHATGATVSRLLQSAAARCLVFACVLGLVAVPASGETRHSGNGPGTTGPTISQVTVGFDGHYKLGYWTPIQITVQGGKRGATGTLRLTTRDGDGELSQIVSNFVLTAIAGGSTTGLLYVKFGQREPRLVIEYVSGDQVLAERTLEARANPGDRTFPLPMAGTDELVLTLGPSIGVNDALRTGPRPATAVAISSIAQLPTAWYGYEGVDAVVIATSKSDLLRGMTPGLIQSQALIEWIEMGGRLVMCVGAEAPRLLPPGTLLADLAPGTFREMTTLRRTAPLEGYLDTVEHIDVDVRFRADVPKLENVEGQIEAYEGNLPSDLPLIIRAPRVFGQVVFVGIDLDRAPFSSWFGRSDVVNKLLGRSALKAVAVEDQALGAVTTVGYNDLSGQLRSALDQFADVPTVPFFAIALLVFAYLLLVGPLDFWLVKKVLRRMELTWVTFPAVVLAVSGTAYFAAYWVKGETLRMNQAELVDVDLASGQVRGTVWANIYSPRPDTYSLSLATMLPGGDKSHPHALMSWLGLPGSGLGAMNARGDSPQLFRQAYTFAPSLNAIDKMPIQVWSTKSVAARWRQRATLPLKCQLRADSDAMLTGTLENDLAVDLQGARLYYDRWVYPIAELPAGQSIKVGEHLQPLLSQTLLTRERAVDDRIAVSDYDQQALDVDRIIEMMMFHGVAGGSNYTGLWNRYQHFTDLSGHLRTGRAVLTIPVATPIAELQRDGQPLAPDDTRRTSYLRFVIPVDNE